MSDLAMMAATEWARGNAGKFESAKKFGELVAIAFVSCDSALKELKKLEDFPHDKVEKTPSEILKNSLKNETRPLVVTLPDQLEAFVAPPGSVLFQVQGLRSIAVDEQGAVTLTADALFLNGSIDPEGGTVAGNFLPNDGLSEELQAGRTADIEHR